MAALRAELDKDIEFNDLVFCRNDPVYILSSHALRKPDVVGVNTGTIVDIVDRRSVNKLSNIGPSKAAFAWHELLMFIEFRLVDEKIEYSPSGLQCFVSESTLPVLTKSRQPTLLFHLTREILQNTL
jgi:hypothetical protein